MTTSPETSATGSTPNASPAPTVIGRRALTTWHLLLLGLWVLSVSAVFLGMEWPALLTLTLVATGWLIVAGPAVVFLSHTVKHRDAGVGRSMRRSATGSAIALLVVGLLACVLDLSTRDLMMPVTLTVFRYLCYLYLALGVAVLVRAWTARVADEQPERFVFRHQGATGTGVFLALVATVLMPKFSGGSKSSAYRSVIESDLRNLVVAQEIFFMDSARYAGSVAELPGFRVADGADGPVIEVGTTVLGWSATMMHLQRPGMTCGVAVNVPNPVDASVDSAQVVCQ